ncbi:uncharacterized protein NP_6232A (plasmid) [Natronomonas pharaonis DSM 2160]|uniref:Uncharacterized protein n=1 Tax=Natronomonas pharaonis (strain ATCC 35678 / DSM 2160 / CIP 103997 / JCM 8858 / NBRC 14720 / NCIMB 2260 / Gabara) TaxID=348780 RepID=Q3ILX4_NATPD|nr:hypothetical protein [Natronomonas pharaonis]CAI50896.1 uncharacterized protein NP_6232A [Natronomonas pharaonis DSM 2160]
MESPNSDSLQGAVEEYGPRTDHRDIAAGYAAAVGAISASVLYIASVWVIDSSLFTLEWNPYFTALEFYWVVYSSLAGLVVTIPAAFLVGVAGERLSPSKTKSSGMLKGAVGTVATYAVAFVLLSALLFVTGAGSTGTGTALFTAVELAGLIVGVGFALTWWLTIPIGCAVGCVYTTRQSATSS